MWIKRSAFGSGVECKGRETTGSYMSLGSVTFRQQGSPNVKRTFEIYNVAWSCSIDGSGRCVRMHRLLLDAILEGARCARSGRRGL